MKKLFRGTYQGCRVLVTGHTGFKGSWLAYWLHRMGASVTGFSLEPPTQPNHHDLLRLPIETVIGDVRNQLQLENVVHKLKPDFIFHLAAQPLVRASYDNPTLTFDTNVMGTVNVCEAARKCESVKAVVNITSDKCYRNHEWHWGYRESDELGGHDPYAASKACAEFVTESYRRSFSTKENPRPLFASVRAGNVIGGGDWAVDRLIPDVVRMLERKETLNIRNPLSKRPWQHVLEPLSGYLELGSRLLHGEAKFAESWNFGPDLEANVTVRDLLHQLQEICPSIEFQEDARSFNRYEHQFLHLDCTKAKTLLGWKSVWPFKKSLEKTMKWYVDFIQHKKINTEEDLENFVLDANTEKLIWTL